MKVGIGMNNIVDKYDVCIIGAGHAGCEAALACSRRGFKTILFTVNIESIALMPCNPNIGGTSKGHLVKEIDALGGEMGKNIDKTFIQSKMLNKSKGPAVYSLRAQADKAEYSRSMRETLQNQDNLSIKQGEVCELLSDVDSDGMKRIKGVKLNTGVIYLSDVVILCTGTYLKARCLCGESIIHTGPNGLQSADHLTDSLKNQLYDAFFLYLLMFLRALATPKEHCVKFPLKVHYHILWKTHHLPDLFLQFLR